MFAPPPQRPTLPYRATFSVPMFRRRPVHHQNEGRCWKHMQLDLNLLDLILSTSTFADLAICLLLLITFGWFPLPLEEQTFWCLQEFLRGNKQTQLPCCHVAPMLCIEACRGLLVPFQLKMSTCFDKWSQGQVCVCVSQVDMSTTS